MRVKIKLVRVVFVPAKHIKDSSYEVIPDVVFVHLLII